jgi:hypothetical protein
MLHQLFSHGLARLGALRRQHALGFDIDDQWTPSVHALHRLRAKQVLDLWWDVGNKTQPAI